MKSNKLKYKLRRWRIIIFNWEYWSFNVVYFPIYFYWFYLSIKARSFFFFSTSNPAIENAGFVMESKKAIYDILPKLLYPNTALIAVNAALHDIKAKLKEQELRFPMVAKPNIGERGNAVKKLYSIEDIIAYQQNSKVDFLLQEWCNYENEIGAFYCKYPNQKIGFLTGIVRKEFMAIVGNGINTIEELLLQEDRFFLQYQTLKTQQSQLLQTVLPKGEEKVIVPYGNHCRGTKFIDDSHLIDEELNVAFNNICSQIPQFYFGRMDIRFESWELLRQGKNFSIIELNGAGSEPTHIYDPKHSVFFAWKEIARHIKMLYEVGRLNKIKYETNYLTMKEGLQMFKAKKQYDSLINLNV